MLESHTPVPTSLHVGRPNLGNTKHFFARLEEMLERNWLTNDGPFVQEFEQRIAEYIGVRHCVAVCNGTVALEIAIRALGLSGEVIVPSFTFIATAHALQWQGLTPIFCDIDDTHTINPAVVETLITPQTSGILAVHTWGRPCNIEALTSVAQRHGIELVLDAAHAFGCSYGGEMIGRFGRAEIFSFHATKVVHCFEGGAVVTNDDELADRIRLMRNFGFAGYDNVEHLGTNGKMSEVCAAMGLTSLESLDEFVAVNRSNYELYRKSLEGLPGIELVRYPQHELSNYQYVVAEVDDLAAGISRDELIAVLHENNVFARRYFYPGCHRMQPYRSQGCSSHSRLPCTDALASRVLVLPTGRSIGANEIKRISRLLKDSIAGRQAARRSLRAGIP